MSVKEMLWQQWLERMQRANLASVDERLRLFEDFVFDKLAALAETVGVGVVAEQSKPEASAPVQDVPTEVIAPTIS